MVKTILATVIAGDPVSAFLRRPPDAGSAAPLQGRIDLGERRKTF
jgi:hypothetical protein